MRAACDKCGARPSVGPLTHRSNCPLQHHETDRVTTGRTDVEKVFFSHPDLIALDLAITYWYPEVVNP
jgi:hypothetical protein